MCIFMYAISVFISVRNKYLALVQSTHGQRRVRRARANLQDRFRAATMMVLWSGSRAIAVGRAAVGPSSSSLAPVGAWWWRCFLWRRPLAAVLRRLLTSLLPVEGNKCNVHWGCREEFDEAAAAGLDRSGQRAAGAAAAVRGRGRVAICRNQ